MEERIVKEKKLVIFIDSGDTLVDESTEIRKVPDGVVYEAQFIPGAEETLLELKKRGYPLVLVADGLKESFDRIYESRFLESPFRARAISEIVGERKPSPKMFQTAMDLMKLGPEEKSRIIMVGNNLARDIAGANRFGIRSVLMAWSPRYSMTPKTEEEQPDYRIEKPEELLELAEKIEQEISQ